MNLSPFDMKSLLHHILSGKEFGVERSCKLFTFICSVRLSYKWGSVLSACKIKVCVMY